MTPRSLQIVHCCDITRKSWKAYWRWRNTNFTGTTFGKINVSDSPPSPRPPKNNIWLHLNVCIWEAFNSWLANLPSLMIIQGAGHFINIWRSFHTVCGLHQSNNVDGLALLFGFQCKGLKNLGACFHSSVTFDLDEVSLAPGTFCQNNLGKKELVPFSRIKMQTTNKHPVVILISEPSDTQTSLH